MLARYTTAAALARLADEGARVALLLQVLAVGRGAAFGGLLVAALMVPHVLAAPAVGALADRVRRRRPLYAGGLLLYAVCLLAAAWCAGPAPVAAFGFAIAGGCAAPLLIGGLTSLLGELVGNPRPGDSRDGAALPGGAGNGEAGDGGRLQRAFGLDVSSYSAAGIAGPAVAALVAGWAGALWSVVALSLSCAVAAALVVSLPIPAREPQPRERRRDHVVRVIARRPALAAVTAAATVSAFAQGSLPIAAALIAGERQDPALAGLTLSAMAVGSLTGSLLFARCPVRADRPEVVALTAVAASAVPFAVLPLADGRWLTLVLFAAAGLLTGPALALIMMVRDRESPPGVRTQVFTVSAGLKVTAGAGGVAIAGLLTGIGSGTLLLAVAACIVAAATTGAALLGRKGLAG